jgi:hypothetical protein
MVPNRAGLWSRADGTPFGQGKPYSAGQLETQLRLHGFLPEKHFSALYMLPSGREVYKGLPHFWKRWVKNFRFWLVVL